MKPLGSIPVPWHRRLDDTRFKFGPGLVFAVGAALVVFAWPRYEEVPSRKPAQNFYSESGTELTANSITQQNVIPLGHVD